MNIVKKYPKFTLLIILFILAYVFFSSEYSKSIHDFIISIGYWGSFISGVLYTYGFSTPIATGFFILIGDNGIDPIIAGLIGGVGAMIGDLIIFKFARVGFSDEIKRLAKEKFFRAIRKIRLINNKWAIVAIGAIVIASPLPDEIGVFLISAATNLPEKGFMPLSYLFNTLGIMFLIFLGKAY